MSLHVWSSSVLCGKVMLAWHVDIADMHHAIALLTCRWTWTMWGQFLAAPALLCALYSLTVSWHRWRYGYYHVHQAAEDLKSDDICIRWSALDTISNVCIDTVHCPLTKKSICLLIIARFPCRWRSALNGAGVQQMHAYFHR